MPVVDKELLGLNQEKHDLLRLHNNNKISDKKFQEKYDELEETIRVKTQEFIKKFKVEFDAKPIKRYESETKLGPKIKGTSYSSTIGRALADPNIKNIDEAIDYVMENKSGYDREKVRVYILKIIRLVKTKKQPRWAKFKFDKRSFMLTKDETWRG